MDRTSIIKAGEIASIVKKWIKPQIKKDMPLLEIAEKIENKIIELGGFPAFPTNLSINEQAAHYTPNYNDDKLAHGLLKVDFGVHVNGWISDNAFSLDLEDNIKNKKLIEASLKALEKVEESINENTSFKENGKLIEDTIKSYGFQPVRNLSGHSLEKFNLHAGKTIPNINNSNKEKIGIGLIAIEPFATDGNGLVHDGIKGNIYILIDNKKPRSPFARETLEYIKENYNDLPFASRWIIKKMGSKAILGIKQLENENILHQYSVLTEEKGKLVSQAENTFLIEKDKVTITTK